MIDYPRYDENDDVFSGWATVSTPWTSQTKAHARIKVRGTFTSCELEDITVDDVDWVEVHTVDGFREGLIETEEDIDGLNEQFLKYFEAMPDKAQNEALEGADMWNADGYGITL